MRLHEDDKALLRSIQIYARKAKSFVASMKEAEYLRDAKTQLALERALEIIGEASKGLSQEAREAFPDVPFTRMIGQRNLLAHGYGEIVQERLWQTAKKDIPALLRALDSGPKFR